MRPETIILGLCALAVFMLLEPGRHKRLREVDGKYEKAWFLTLPGFETFYSSEVTVELDRWVGTKIDGMKITEGDPNNPEVQAAATLKALGIYGEEYALQERDGHYVLHKETSSRRYFTLYAHYRISPWRPEAAK